MRELRSDVHKEFNAMIQDVVEEIQQAEKTGEGLDVTQLFGKQSGHYQKLNEIFDQAERRYKENPKRFL